MDHNDIGTNSSVSTGVSDGSTKFALNSPTVQSRSKSYYDAGSNSLGKVEATPARPCAIIGPDRVLPRNPDDTMYSKTMPGEAWPPPENIYRRPPEYPTKVSDYQPTRNISPRQTFQENMQRIMVPPTFSSMKGSEVSNLKNPKLNMPQEAKYCDVPYNVNSVNSEHKSVRNFDIPMSNVNPYTSNMPPPYGWPTGVNVRPLRPYGAQEFYQYQDFPSCAGPRPMTMIRPNRPPLHEESAQVYSERLYQDANIRFKPYPTGKEKHQQPRYDHIRNYPSTFHPPALLPPHKYDMQSVHGHPYPVCPPVSYKYLDKRIHEPFVDGYHRSHIQQANFNSIHSQVVPPPYGPLPGSCMQNNTYSDASTKPINVNKIQFENNNKVYVNLESRNKNYSIPENLYYNDMNHSQAMRGEILLPSHSMLSIPPMPQHPIYRKDNNPLKPYDYNPNYRIVDQSVNVNHSLQRIPLQFSPSTVAISPSDSNTSNDTTHTIGTPQEDCGYVSQSSTASVRSFDSSNIPMPHDIYRRQSYNNYDMVRNTFHPVARAQIPRNKTSSSNKKNIDVRQFLQMWNEGDEEVSEANKEAAAQSHTKKISSQSEIINNQEQLYVLGLVNVPNEDLGKYDHIQKISKLPENIKGYNSIEILNQYEELLETPHFSNHNRSRDYNILSKSQIDKDITTRMPRPVSPLDVEAKISQSVIHKEVGCNFEIKPCSPQMLNVEVATPVQNILGERMIEKVANPIITKSPNLNRGENNKSQNTVYDAVNTASCKMINDQYSSRSSPNRIKTSNYNLQDLERNAGLCLASLPQLDNDIELNFPEINQQFIKANQVESNVSSGLQNLPHIDLEQTHHMPRETTRIDSRQQNLSPQLACGPGLDKEFSKLSKYRKGRKLELTSSHDITKQEIIKSGESLAAQQRIDSVIIKNPDTNKTQDNESIKITSETNHSIHKETQQSYSSMQYERNTAAHHLPSETAIDFSLNRSEDEIAVNYLNDIESNINQNLPPLEVFEGLNDGDDISLTSGNIKAQNSSTKLNGMPSAEVLTDPKSECPQFKISKEYNKKNTNQEEIDKKEDKSLKKVRDKSPTVSLASEEYNALGFKNEIPAKQKLLTIENVTENVCTENTEVRENPGLKIQNNHTKCQELSEEILFTSSVDAPKYKEEIKEVEPGYTTAGEKETHLSSPVKAIINNTDQYSSDKCLTSLKNEVFSNEGSDITIDTKSFTDNNHITDNKTIEEVLNDLSDQDIDNLDAKSDSSFGKVNNDNNCEGFTSSDNTLEKNEDIFEFEPNLSLASETNNETIGVVLEESDIGVARAVGICNDINQAVTSECNANNSKSHVRYNEELVAEEFQQKTENKMRNTPDISSDTEKNSCVKKETDLQDLAIEITKYGPHTILKSPEMKRDSKCISDKKIMNNSDKILLSLATEAFSKKNNNESTQSDCVKTMDVSDVDCLINQSDPNSNVKLYIHNPKDDTESVTTSTIEFETYRNSIEASSAAVELNVDYETKEDIVESECLYDKADSEHDDTIKESCLLVKIPILETSDIEIEECIQEVKIDGVPNIEVEFECSPDQTCIPATADEKLCVPSENMSYPENLPVLTAESRHKTDIDDDLQTKHETQLDIAESEPLSCKPHTNFTQPVEESNLTVSNKDPSVIIFECKREKETQKEIKTYVDKAESEYISDYVEEYCVHISHDTSPVNLRTGSKKEIEIQDNDLISAVKMDLNELDITDEFKDETKTMNFENNNLQSWICQSHVSVINMGHTKCQKELFSPWFQKLLMFTEGICQSNESKNIVEHEDNSGKNIVKQEDDSFLNVELVFSENKNIDAFNSHNEVNDELQHVDKEPNLLNDINITNDVLQSEHVTLQDDGSLTKKYQAIKNDEMQLSAAVTDNSAVKIKPRKICKRSLSEPALEAFKDNNDINYVQPCKRIKGIENNNGFLESHAITEDICNIIQTNRRNSISTFYNEDNVYIVIDDLILTEETDDSDKLCYTENTEDFLTSKESTNCEKNLNLENNTCSEESSQVCEYSDSLQHIEDKSTEHSWVDDVACIETVFSDDVAENIIIDVHASPDRLNSLELECVDGESNLFYDGDHIDKLKSIYGRTICNDNTQLIETLYRTPQMNVNKTLYHIESPDPKECLDAINDRCLESDKNTNCSDILEHAISSFKVIDNKENMTDNLSLYHNQYNQDTYPNFNHDNHFKFDDFPTEEQVEKLKIHSCESSNDNVSSNIQKENSRLSCSSSPEVSSTTSEEKNSSILLKITNCNGSRVSQINQINTESHTKLSYKLTENREYRSYSSNFSSSRTLITKAAQKYIPPLKETINELKVKLPLPQHRLHLLKQLKIAKVKPKIDATASTCFVKKLNHTSKKQKPKFEDVLKSIDEINFKRHKDNIKKGKISIPKVVIKKNENGAHYASSKIVNRKETFNPDLTGRKWQPWVFLEKNNFIDRMALQNKAKAVYCHRKNSYVLLEKFRKYKSIYNANFVISQPKSETKGNLKYTIRLKHS